jgi:hypothetical protein
MIEELTSRMNPGVYHQIALGQRNMSNNEIL